MSGANAGRTVWSVADNLEKMLLFKFLLLWANFILMYVCFHVKYNIDP